MKIEKRLETLKDLKEALKEVAIEIRAKKNQRKGARYGVVPGLDNLRYQARHHHLAYSMLRGRDLYDIEATCKADNHPDLGYVDRIMKPVLDHWKELEKNEG